MTALARTGLFIDGEFTAATSHRVLGVEDPATEEIFAEVADGSVRDALDALAAAAGAQRSWAFTPPRRRAEILHTAADLMRSRAQELAITVTREMGKPYVQSLDEVAYAADYLRWYAEEAVRIGGRTATPENGVGHIVTLSQPVGPCLFVTPWNFPLAMGARKIGPALAAGCTCVVKPAAQTPLSMLALAEILREAGVPAGVVNVVVTSESSAVVATLMDDPRLRKISFTGSTEVGRHLVRQSADQLLRVSMELGGNAPFIVFADADLSAAVDGAMAAKLRNNGEACTSANRIFVHSSVAQQFSTELAERFGTLAVGPGLDPGTDIGPLVDAKQLHAVADLVDDAVVRGGSVLSGGSALERTGHFMAPTVIEVPGDARMLAEEIFGPVAPIVTFDDDSQALSMANSSSYGLASYIYTRDLDRAISTAQLLEAGMVAINQGTVSNVAAPFGGVKHSGFGREGGPEGIKEYLETKYLALHAGVPPREARSA